MQDRFVLQDPEAERFRVLPCRGPRIVTVKSARALKQCRPMAAGMPQAALEERGWGLVGAMEHGGKRRDRTADAGLFRPPTNGPKWLRISGHD
jgi:hypothetical protein